MDKGIKVKWINEIPQTVIGTTWGIPWKEGELKREENLNLTSKTKESLPIQSWPLAYWPDGSVKWSAHSAILNSRENGHYYISKGQSPEQEAPLKICEQEDYIEVNTGKIISRINKYGSSFIRDIHCNKNLICTGGKLICIREEKEGTFGERILREEFFESKITGVIIEQKGPIRGVIKVEGIHKAFKSVREWLPFSIRLYFYANTDSIRMIHNFIYDGDTNIDFIKGLGMAFSVPMTGQLYNRQVRIAGDTGLFSEVCQFVSRRYEKYNNVYPKQVEGTLLEDEENDNGRIVDMVQDMAVWSSFKLMQDSSEHYVIQKQVKENCSWIDTGHGRRSKGLVYAGGEKGGMAIALKDFWQKYPSTLEIEGLKTEEASIKVWFWPPDAKPMDLSHYDTETHTVSSYEGAVQLRSTPYGIANTSEVKVFCFSELPQHEKLLSCASETQSHALLVCEPEHYYKTKAFGVWSMRDVSTPTNAYIEEQLDVAMKFYQNEIEQRKWYGFWNYGDFMHTYDSHRHTWKYDVGGFAWQNTELAPNMWLWYSFLRTGRYDIFRIAEAMTRHTSEVDVYHIGKYKGLGSRHNVIHWGCSCKEARIAMSGLHRYYYYLTADERLGDIFEEVRDADYSTLNIDPMREYHPKDQYPTHARSGPDWAAFSSNWLTQWERFEDKDYRDKILNGISCLKNMPYRLLSGSCFGYDPKNGELFYMGEKTAGYHLAICMGEPQVWMEMAQVLKDTGWENMLAEFGEFYYLSRKEKVRQTSEEISDNWDWPMFATGIAAYAAARNGDEKLAKKVWNILLNDKTKRCVELPIKSVMIDVPGFIKPVMEIPWITTNIISQWCLNAIVCLELIGEYVKDMDMQSENIN